MKVYFITETTLKNNSPINLNVNTEITNIAIEDAQDIHIQQAIGSHLYQKLEDLIDAGTITDSGNAAYKTLLDKYVIPATIRWSVYEILGYAKFKIMNKSVLTENSDNSSPVDAADLKFFMQENRNKAEFITQRLIDFVFENRSDYPEYSESIDCDDIAPSSDAYFSGMQLDDDDICGTNFN